MRDICRTLMACLMTKLPLAIWGTAIEDDKVVPFRFLIGHTFCSFVKRKINFDTMLGLNIFYDIWWSAFVIWCYLHLYQARMIHQEQSTGRWHQLMRSLAAFLLSCLSRFVLAFFGLYYVQTLLSVSANSLLHPHDYVDEHDAWVPCVEAFGRDSLSGYYP